MPSPLADCHSAVLGVWNRTQHPTVQAGSAFRPQLLPLLARASLGFFCALALVWRHPLSCMMMGWQPSQEGDRSFSHHTLGHQTGVWIPPGV